MKRLLLLIALLPGMACAAQQNLIYQTGTSSPWKIEGKKIHENTTELYTNKANKASTVMLWSEWANGVSFTTSSPPVAYNGALYKCIAPYTKSSGDYPDTQTDYFAEVTGDGGGSGDIEGVTAGNGITGGGTSGTVSVAIDPTYTQRRVSSACSAGTSIRAIAEDGTVTCETDDTGSGSVPDGTVNGQVLLWSTSQWAASTPPWITTASLGNGIGTWLATPSGANLATALTSALPASKGGTGLTSLGDGVATALAAAVDGTGGLASVASQRYLLAGTGLTVAEDTPSAGTDTISVTANTYQAYDADWLGVTANGASLISSANYAAMKTLLDTDDIQTLTGIAAGTANLGTFTGTTIADSSTIKTGMQALETAVEGKPTIIASGAYTVDTASINANTCASAVAVTASGVATTDTIIATPSSILSSITGFGVTTAGAVRVDVYPTSGNVNFQFCNPTGAAIDPGSVTFNWKVIR